MSLIKRIITTIVGIVIIVSIVSIVEIVFIAEIVTVIDEVLLYCCPVNFLEITNFRKELILLYYI